MAKKGQTPSAETMEKISSVMSEEDEEAKRLKADVARLKVQTLLNTMKMETENFAKTIAAQIRAVAYVNGALNKSSSLIFEG